MENRKKTNFCSQVAGIGGYLEKSLGTSVKQEVIENLLVLQEQLR
jgi:hypothetical protein